MSIKWKGNEAIDEMRRQVNKRLHRACMTLVNYARVNSSKVGKASLPGQFPFKQSGHHRRNLTYEVNAYFLRGRWGTNVIYSRWLQEGTTKMDPRPWMELTNQQSQMKVSRIMGGRLT